jgi:tetratricopeptide (TPR) repeat protein
MPLALAGLVETDLAQKKVDSARARVDGQLAKSTNDPVMLLLAGNTYYASGDAKQAESFYRRLLEVDPNSIDAYARLGAIYLSQNRLDEARKSFEDISKKQGKPVVAETMIGTILARQNKMDEARASFERAVQLDPRAAVAANNLAWDYAERGGNLDIALNLAQVAKAQHPESPQVTDTLGWVYYKKGMYGPAVTTLREAVQQGPSNPVSHYHLGLAYAKQGNNEEAKRSLREALRLVPTFRYAEDAKRVLGTLPG